MTDGSLCHASLLFCFSCGSFGVYFFPGCVSEGICNPRAFSCTLYGMVVTHLFARVRAIEMPVIDFSFKLLGGPIPVDHGYHVYSSISQVLPAIHGDDQIGVHPIFGRLLGNRMLALTESSHLTLRLPVDRVPDILPLAGRTLDLGDGSITVGVPNTRALVPSAALESRLVIIKGFMEPETFLDAVRRQLAALEIRGEPFLMSTGNAVVENATRNGGTKSPWVRRTLRIRDKEIVGFALRVEELTAEESILLQEKGIGGRRRLGCGIFVPARDTSE